MNIIIIITLVLIALILLFKLFNLQENIIILSSVIILLFLISLFNKNTYEKFTTAVASTTPCENINIDGKTISIGAFQNLMKELNNLSE